MSIKALQRRAREARFWLGSKCLPLWAEYGVHKSGGFFARLGSNYRAYDEDGPADAAGQQAMMALFKLAGHAGYDTEAATALIEDAERVDPAEDIAMPDWPAGAATLEGACLLLREALRGFAMSPDDASAAAAARAFDTLMDEFLTPEGGWVDGHASDGLPLGHDIRTHHAGPLADVLAPLLALAEA